LMVEELRKYFPALWQGAVVAMVLIFLLYTYDSNLNLGGLENASTFVITLNNILVFVLYCLGISFIIFKFSLGIAIGLLSILISAMIADSYLNISQNPITVPFIILFWIGVCYLLAPGFFKKYRYVILAVYGIFIIYYLIDLLTTPNYTNKDRSEFAELMVVPLPVFVFLWLYEQWRWFTTLKNDKAKAELALLKSQVNPHFFFNTLNNLYGLVVTQSPQAPEVILRLSDMMRHTIYNGKEDTVTLNDEVNYLQAYIDLHKIRHQKKVDIRFEHEINEKIQVAPLLFIILLENAFKHGVERLVEDAYIHIELTGDETQVLFAIENNFDPKESARKPGIGLDNLKQRLAHLYPKKHELIVEKTESTYKTILHLDLSL
ncbi:MAG: histidine kinase, partial [Bacteroidota bacterium]